MTSLPTQTLSYFVILGGGVVLFLLLAILPAHKETAELDFEISNVNTKIEEQKILTPVFESLMKKAELKPPEGLNYVPKEKLKTDNTHKVADRFQEMAETSMLELVEFSPGHNERVIEACLAQREPRALRAMQDPIQRVPQLVEPGPCPQDADLCPGDFRLPAIDIGRG